MKYNKVEYSEGRPPQSRDGFSPYPATWGRGEWTAETLEDAKQMAIDFANGIA